MFGRIIYRSKMSSMITKDDIGAIESHSQKANHLRGITGALIAFDGRFIQILEGEQDQITALTDIIRDDPRHYEFEVLQHVAVPEPRFSGWDMKMISAPSPDLRHCLTQLHQVFDDELSNIELRARLCEGLIYIIAGQVEYPGMTA
ncbi:BLUF domain-containing protein [Alteromonas sp. CYL-A6]|uniref:BLUF domain-containing protein n=1 Tax=Alteromonas nitratireducens TaxID=3390813 RepID=UPI0034C4BA0B